VFTAVKIWNFEDEIVQVLLKLVMTLLEYGEIVKLDFEGNNPVFNEIRDLNLDELVEILMKKNGKTFEIFEELFTILENLREEYKEENEDFGGFNS
jgi:ATP-dependent protease Clp ATPase subunit